MILIQNIFSLLFYAKRSKADSNRKTNVYFRITLDGKRAELSIRRKVVIDKWNAKVGRAKGFTKEAQELNRSFKFW